MEGTDDENSEVKIKPENKLSNYEEVEDCANNYLKDKYKNFKIIRVMGDGLCLYRSISDQI